MLHPHNFQEKCLHPFSRLSHVINHMPTPVLQGSLPLGWTSLAVSTPSICNIMHSHLVHNISFFPTCTIPSGKYGHGSPNTVNLDYPQHSTENLAAIESVKTMVKVIIQGSGIPPAGAVKNCMLISIGTNEILASVYHFCREYTLFRCTFLPTWRASHTLVLTMS